MEKSYRDVDLLEVYDAMELVFRYLIIGRTQVVLMFNFILNGGATRHYPSGTW